LNLTVTDRLVGIPQFVVLSDGRQIRDRRASSNPLTEMKGAGKFLGETAEGGVIAE